MCCSRDGDSGTECQTAKRLREVPFRGSAQEGKKFPVLTTLSHTCGTWFLCSKACGGLVPAQPQREPNSSTLGDRRIAATQ